MREPGASEVLMCGATFKPASTAFFASRPAASNTLGFEVLVHEVIAAISTSPLPSEISPTFGCVAGASDCADSSVGWPPTISTTWRGAPGAAASVAAGAFSTASCERTKWRVCSCAAGRLNPFSLGDLLYSDANCDFTLPSSMRSCGRFGPARLGATVPRSSDTTFVYWMSASCLDAPAAPGTPYMPCARK
jgi:hypothetical protein